LHHVIIRGIIFKDKADQDNFIDRLSRLIPESQTACYAWALMTNHAHFLFRSGQGGLAHELKISLSDLTRKLGMTAAGVGYAVLRGEAISIEGNYQLID
jgi:hypothetical protein